MAVRQSRRTLTWFLAGGAIAALSVGVVAVARSRDTGAAPLPISSAVPSLESMVGAASSARVEVAAGSRRNDILSKATLGEAIEVARPLMVNTNGRLDEGAALLTLWASKNLTWDQLESLHETTPALFRKDPDAERGKRLCISGEIREIRAEKTLATRLSDDRPSPLILTATPPSSTGGYDSLGTVATAAVSGAPPILETPPPSEDWTLPNGGKVFMARLVVKPSDAEREATKRANGSSRDVMGVEVIAVKSSGTLVDGSSARACGVLTGVTLPAAGVASMGTSDVTEHRIVGLFDLIENRTEVKTAVE